MAASSTTKEKEIIEAAVPEADKLVTIRIPRENKDQEDVVVWVNARRFLIKRGVPVEVPESVATILEQQEAMFELCMEFESKVQK